jgi:hypothetical protein
MAKNIEDVDVDEVTTDYSRIGDGWNPLGENVIEREYTKVNRIDKSKIKEIKEPTFEPPVLDSLESEEEDKQETEPKDVIEDDFGWDGMGRSNQSSKRKKDDEYDDLSGDNDLSPSEKRKASEALVDGVIEGYVFLHEIGKRWATISEDKLVERAMKGEIDLDMPIPVSETEVLSVQDFIQSYNHSVEEILVVEEEFIEKIRPPLIRIAQKNNVGLSDEALVGILLAKDVGIKAVGVFGLRKSLNKTLEMTTKMYRQQRQEGANIPPPPSRPMSSGGMGGDIPPNEPPQFTPPPTSSENNYEETEDFQTTNIRGTSERLGVQEIEDKVKRDNLVDSNTDIVFDIQTEEDIEEVPMEIIPPSADIFKEEEEK